MRSLSTYNVRIKIMLERFKTTLKYSIAISMLSSFGYASEENRNDKATSGFDKDSFQQRLAFGKKKKALIEQEEAARRALEDEEANSPAALERRNSVHDFRKLDPNGGLPSQPQKAGDASAILDGMLQEAFYNAKQVCKIAYRNKKNTNSNHVSPFADIYWSKNGPRFDGQSPSNSFCYMMYNEEMLGYQRAYDSGGYPPLGRTFENFQKDVVSPTSKSDQYKALQNFTYDSLGMLADAGINPEEYELGYLVR